MLESIFTESVIADFKEHLNKQKTNKVVTQYVIDAMLDIINCIDNKSIKTDDDLDDYIDNFYYSTQQENEYFIISSAILGFYDGEFDSVASLFEQIHLD